jgi:hypothetical protein
MSVFGPIASPHGHYQSRNVTANLQSAFRHCSGYDVRQQGVARDNNVCTGNTYPTQQDCQPQKAPV